MWSILGTSAKDRVTAEAVKGKMQDHVAAVKGGPGLEPAADAEAHAGDDLMIKKRKRRGETNRWFCK